MNGWCFLAGGSFVSLFSSFCLSAFNNTPYVHCTQREHLEQAALYRQRSGSFWEESAGHFWEAVVYSGVFVRCTSGVQQLPALGSEGWLCLPLSRSRHPSPDTMQPFSFCQHTLPLGLTATMENSIKHGWICSLTSCEQQVNIVTAMYQMDGWIPPNTCGLFRSKEWTLELGKELRNWGCWHTDKLGFEQYPNESTLKMTLC